MPSLLLYALDDTLLLPIYCLLVEQYLQVYRRAQDIPQRKFDFPQTEAQEIGWDTKPLVRRCDDVIPSISA